MNKSKNFLDAVSHIKSNEYIWTHSMAATPQKLIETLCQHSMSQNNITLMQLHTESVDCLKNPELKGHLRNRCFFAGAYTRSLINEGNADYVPIFLSDIPKIFRTGEQKVDTTLIQVSPPDDHGFCSLGISVEATKAACEVSKKIIAHINPKMPRTHGDSFIHISKIDYAYEEAVEMNYHHSSIQTDITNKIGEHAASLIDDGSCLQMGIGAIPDAVLSCLDNHKNLGIHTEMFSNGVIPLVEKGVINNSLKEVYKGKIVTGFVLGDQKLYDFVNDNPYVNFLDIAYVNDTKTIRKNPKVVAINSAIEIDLTGQVCADSIGTKIYSGVGGQMDFIRGAALSEGGKSIIAMPSTARSGEMSRISAILKRGAGVVTTRAHVHYIVTEYGIANLKAKSIKERVRAIIDISHPKFREQLEKDAHEFWHVNL